MTTATWATTGGRALWNGHSLAHWSDVLASELVQLFNPVEVWLFGSVATDHDTGDSDLDVLVVLDHYEPANAIAMKHQAILGVSAPVPFDVAFSDPDRMEQRGRLAGTIERAVLLDGILKHRRG